MTVRIVTVTVGLAVQFQPIPPGIPEIEGQWFVMPTE